MIFLIGFTHKTHSFNTEGCKSLSLNRGRPTIVNGESRGISVSLGFMTVAETHQSGVVCPQGGIKKCLEAIQRKEWVSMHKRGQLNYYYY